MKLKTVEIDGKVYAEVSDGKVVYTDDDGTDVAIDASESKKTISRLNGEAMNHRKAKEAAENDLKAMTEARDAAVANANDFEQKLKSYEGITDPAAARKALETVQNLDDKKLLDAGEVERIKGQVAEGFEQKITAINEAHQTELEKAVKDKETVVVERDALQKSLNEQIIGGLFAGSKFISDKCVVDHAHMRKIYGEHFSVEDGRAVARDGSGNVIYSTDKPGEPADPDQALAVLVEADPSKNNILKALMGNGTGSKTNDGDGGDIGDKEMTRADFEKLNSQERAQKMAEGYTLKD